MNFYQNERFRKVICQNASLADHFFIAANCKNASIIFYSVFAQKAAVSGVDSLKAP